MRLFLGIRARRVTRRAASSVLLVSAVLSAGCGPVDETNASVAFSQHADNQQSGNGLSLNGLSLNGLSLNGLSLNGLSLNGLSTEAFRTWFQADTVRSTIVMHYLVTCAMPSNKSLTYTDQVTGETYTWTGGLGVAPDWSTGRPATLAEQQVVSACLAAHVNKYEVHIPLSVQGETAKGKRIAYTSAELSEYSYKEACFFGNLFTSEGIYVASERNNLTPRQSSPRACSISDASRNVNCAPLMNVGSCSTYCTLDDSKTYYLSCVINGIRYQPVTTRMRKQDIYTCGDGVCQVTESCGDGTRYDNCLLDCGYCQ